MSIFLFRSYYHDFLGWCWFAANLFYCLRLHIQYNARGRWPKYYAWNIKTCGVDAASQQTNFIVSGSPSNTLLGEVTKILCLECKVLQGWCCFAANLFYCLRLPIQFNARGGDQKTMLGMYSSVDLMLLRILDGQSLWKYDVPLSIAYLTMLNSSIANWTFRCIAIWTFRCIAIWHPKSIA